MGKDYMRLFVNYAKSKGIWFEVCADGSIGDVYSCGRSINMPHREEFNFGSKYAYNWLKSEHRDLVNGTGDYWEV